MDKRALAILNDTHWGANGWRRENDKQISEEDFAYAKAAGLMFDPIEINHDEVVAKCLAVRQRVDQKNIANAFIVSLATRNLPYRSALGSYACLKYFPDHAWSGENHSCAICGSYDRYDKQKEDLNVLNFERYKWGGVRHLRALYASFDLEQFLKLPPAKVESEHVSVFIELIRCIEQVPVGVSSAKLQSYFPKSIKSNKAERDIIIGILGIAGVLQTQSHHGFLHSFIPAYKRDLPDRRFVDMEYPACWWSQSDGVNHEAISEWFGHLL